MTDVPETTIVETHRVWCDGSGSIRPGAGYKPAALGHPRVYMEIDEKGYVECGYCDRRFVLKGSPAEHGIHELQAGDLPEPGDASVA
ncbi:zinc-finger domain-containing protein [Altericroceibacterium spongiae]|uniref:Zinc-finger domain-containing protein n=1 Tax=Altericroceibacterium spongiae TaxID=2320269 RepID=A0A420EPG6_9SPHN|nr:zinc-finger domain-containing protein [Altericroceibacterium spongiae]RKF22567.1 zinc-finger domain-containing protein [Altericroceibacterium spongiae]